MKNKNPNKSLNIKKVSIARLYNPQSIRGGNCGGPPPPPPATTDDITCADITKTRPIEGD